MRVLLNRGRRHLLYTCVVSLLLSSACFAWAYVHYAHLEAPRGSVWLDDRNGRFIGQLPSADTGDTFGYWPLSQLPRRVEASVLALEDRRFGWHPGVDPVAVLRAAVQNVRSGRRVSGASTVAMQIARMQFDRRLDERYRSWWRKGVETVTAIALTLKFDSDDLLKHYLRITPFGNRSHGLLHAAEFYFGKRLTDLSWAEIAFLAAIPNAPTLNNPFRVRGRERLRGRAMRNLRWLRQQGVLDEPTHAQALQQLVSLKVVPRRVRAPATLHILEHFGMESVGLGRQQLTVDLSLQARAHEHLNQHLDTWRQKGATNAAAMVVDLRQCVVRVKLGSADYFDADNAGAIDHTAISRSPGSTLKPFIYALGFEREAIAPDTVMDDLPVAAGVANADRRYLGPVLPRQALANSRNLPVVRLLQNLGVSEVGWALHRLGLTDDRPADVSRHGLGLALGVMPVSLDQLMQAYSVFALDGDQCQLGSLLRDERMSQPATTEIGPDSARLISLFLSDPQARLPTFKRLGATDVPSHIALKTGTSQNFRDAWTFAWSRDVLVGVWVGRHDAQPMRNVSGSTSAAELARVLITQMSPRTERRFDAPEGMQPYAVCAYTGDAAGDGCARPVTEWLAKPPRVTRAVHVAVDQRTERPASAHTPARFVAVRAVARVPARFGPWLARLATPRSPLELGQRRPEIERVKDAPTIVSPSDGLSLIQLPGVAPRLQSIALRAHTNSHAEQVVWFVNDVPVATGDATRVPRWSLKPGRHVFRAQLAGTLSFSAPVTVTVQR